GVRSRSGTVRFATGRGPRPVPASGHDAARVRDRGPVRAGGGTMKTVFSPARLGPITLRNRVIKAATFEGRTPDALVTDDLIDYHRAPAAGGVGMTTVAYCAVSPEGRTDRQQIWMRPAA